MRNFLSILACATGVAVVRPALACAPAWRGAEAVNIASESALIVWDAERRTEHFVREAVFEGTPSSFGFLVPVPSVPELAEADERIFDDLESFWENQRKTEVHRSFEGFSSFFLLGRPKSMVDASALPAGVAVLSNQRVAGMDAAVLDADSADALGKWLTAHDYDFRPELVRWVEPYIHQHYKVVAFKYAKEGHGATVGARAVRLTFKTERPFFPYREPRDAERVSPQRFRLYVAAPTSVAGLLGDSNARWNGSIRYAGPYDGRALAFAGLARPWVTFFEEVTSKRASGGDLYFSLTDGPRPVAAPPRIVEEPIRIPVELVALLGLVVIGLGALVITVRRRA